MANALKIKAARNGYRRAGFKFSNTEAKVLMMADLNKEQIEALKGDPGLLVSEIDHDPEAEAKEAAKAAKKEDGGKGK